MTVSIRNSSSREKPPSAPTKGDGRPHRYEMIYAGAARRAYADDAVTLIDALIPGYASVADASDRAARRLRLALDVQVRLQAQLAIGGDLGACTDEQRAVIFGGRDIPPSLARWDAPVALVLVTVFYAPLGEIRRPEGPADRQVWLDPSDDWTLLRSLHAAGVVHVGVRDSEG